MRDSASRSITFIVGSAFLPTSLPVLPERAYVSYVSALGRALHISQSATQTEHGRDEGSLPGDWADMHGWPELAATVGRVYESLSPTERSQAVVFTGNYGEASAVAFFAPNVPVISQHNQYWLWGTRGYSGNVLIQVGGTCFAPTNSSPRGPSRRGSRTEDNLAIWICRGIKKPAESSMALA